MARVLGILCISTMVLSIVFYKTTLKEDPETAANVFLLIWKLHSRDNTQVSLKNTGGYTLSTESCEIHR